METLIVGGSGFIGRHLATSLVNSGHTVIIQTRRRSKAQQKLGQLAQRVTLVEQLSELSSVPQRIVSLSGAPIVDRRWSDARKKQLLRSRIAPLEQLASWLRATEQHCETIIIGSAIGFYGFPQDPDAVLDEQSNPSNHYVHTLCRQVEEQAGLLTNHCQRICLSRTGVVLGENGGALAKMVTPARFHLNGKIGAGKQWVSWIHMNDMVAALRYLLDTPDARGAYNLVSPEPTTNAALSRAIAKALDKPLQLPIPALSLRLLMGEAADLLLESQRVIPARLHAHGFAFQYPQIDAAVAQLIE